jgi:hypothetical protein
MTIKGNKLEITFADAADLQKSGIIHQVNITSCTQKFKHVRMNTSRAAKLSRQIAP